MKHRWSLWFLVILAFLFSLIAVGMVSFHVNIVGHGVEPGGQSGIGVLISILGLLITFVVGFQIYNAMEAKDTLMEVGELKSLKQDLDCFKGETKAELNHDLGTFMENMGEHMVAVFLFMESLYFSIAIDNETRVDDNLRRAMEIVEGCDISQASDVNHLSTETAKKNAIRWINKITIEFQDKSLYKKYEMKIAHIIDKLQDVKPDK